MDGEVLREDQWERLKPFAPGVRVGKGDARNTGLELACVVRATP